MISEEKINKNFLNDMKKYEEKTLKECSLHRGVFQDRANEKNALQLAAEWIGRDIKKPARSGYIKLLECQRKTKFDALAYSLEALYVKYAKEYSMDHPRLFDEQVVRVAKGRLENLHQ